MIYAIISKLHFIIAFL